MDNEDSSSDSDSVVEDEADEGYSQRNKRSVGGTEWCGTNDESPPPKPHVEWPPVEGKPTDLRSSYFGNPNFSQTMQLFSRTNHYLGAYPDGTVRGTQDKSDVHTIFEIVNAGSVAHVKIRSEMLKSYVAMNENGKLYVNEDDIEEETIFIEKWVNGYNIYLSKMYQDQNWYIGINKAGKGKWGRKTNVNQKSVQFLPVRLKSEES